MAKVHKARIDSGMAMALKAHDRIDVLEKSKQSPSERCLFARLREIDLRIDALSETVNLRPAGYTMSNMRPQPSPREQWLERECEWLRSELKKYHAR